MSAPVVVVGGSLAGMAAAARLAKNRHEVIMVGAGAPLDRSLGGRFATRSQQGEPIDDLPGMISFPAPWRDLFRKSGRVFETELTRVGLELVPAPPTRHRFDDGSELALGTDRGDQTEQLTRAYGHPTATRWRDLVDRLDDVWQSLRPLGSEYELDTAEQIERSGLHRLSPAGVSVEQLAREIDEPHLAMIIRSTAWRLGSEPSRTPAWCAVQLSVERTFGRWMMQRDGVPTRTGTLVDALTDRLALRRVDVRTEQIATSVRTDTAGLHRVNTDSGTIPAAAVIMAVDPWTCARLTRDRSVLCAGGLLPRLRPARTPAVRHQLEARTTDAPSETIEHSGAGPVVTWTRPVGDQTMVSRHDWPAGTADPGAGLAWSGERTWLRMPPISTRASGRYLVGPHSRGGAGLSATLLSGALASYACHDLLSQP